MLWLCATRLLSGFLPNALWKFSASRRGVGDVIGLDDTLREVMLRDLH